MKKKSETIELRINISRFIEEKLSVYGFKQKKDRLNINGNISMCRYYNGGDILQQFLCGGNIDRIGKYVSYDITVWIKYTKLSNIIDKHFGHDDTTSANIGYNLGYLMPINSYAEWEFHVGEDYIPKAESLVNYIIQYGFPFLEKFSNENSMVESLKNNPLSRLDNKAYLLPLIYCLNNKKDMAFECFDQYIPVYKENFRLYSKSLQKHNSYTDVDIANVKDSHLESYMVFMNKLKQIMKEGKILE